jgi:hypothetical protein
MNNITISGASAADAVLTALAEQLAQVGTSYELIVVGGSALLALGLIERPTRDVDIVALRSGRDLVAADPLPPVLAGARDRVARDLGLISSWLNPGPAGLLDLGLPEGFVDRLERRVYGPALTVSFASRRDQIHLKLYATVDQGPGKHERDLRALEPTREELLAAARWSRTHDPSEGYREMLLRALAYLGIEDADVGA